MANAASLGLKNLVHQTEERTEKELRISAEVTRKKCKNLLHQHRFYMNQAAGLGNPRCVLTGALCK